MIDERTSGNEPGPEMGQVRCRRTDQEISVAEHARCPYCFGRLAEIETGKYACFCDYESGKDPISFGFPEDGSHYQQG